MTEKYDGFLEMERPVVLGRGRDPERGPYEDRRVGMTRNASEQNRRTLRVYLYPAPHVILDQNVPLRGWYKSKYEPRGVRPRPCYTEALLTQPYGGACPVRCAFCYVNNGIRGYRGQGITVVDPGYPLKIAEQLERMQFGWNAYISSFTEPFQPLEAVFHNTEQLSEIITSYGLPLFYLTRQIPPDWAVGYLLKSRYSYQQFSLITSDRETYRRLSPGAAPLDDILRYIKGVLKPQGIYVSVQVNPILFGIVDVPDIQQLIRELGKAGVDHCIFKFVEIVSPAAKALIEKMRRMFPGNRANWFETYFSETIGGLRTIREDTRIDALRRFARIYEMSHMTMGLCYEYRYRRDAEGRILDKTGVSLGPEFTTAAQCHGPAIPIHVKHRGKFVPLEGRCPPSGCLYCAGVKEKPPCGVELLGRATALRPADYNHKYWRTR